MEHETPRLSPSLAGLVLTCPAKAYARHRLLGGEQSKSTVAMDKGKLFERLITGHGINDLAVLPFDDWRTKAAKEARDDAIAHGLIPVKQCEMEEVVDAAQTIRGKIEGLIGLGFDDLDHQCRFEWEADGCACSGVLDCLTVANDHAIIYDLKKTASANPAMLESSVVKYGYHIQHAAYIEVVEFVYPHLKGRIKAAYIFYEIESPHCVTVAQFDGPLRHLGASKWNAAKKAWLRCLERDEWPEYSTDDLGSGYAILRAKPWDIAQISEEFIDD